ncbi:MAG: radical SAM protein [Actinobacteria bacterium]|nr:MAG: radical SAM protein [Actinomycetota bacterium]
MKVKMILPALAEASSPCFRQIKYSLFPPLGLATLAAYLDEDDEVELVDEHVEPVSIDDEPDVVVIQAYVTSAYRAYEIADHYRKRGCHVCLGGLHVTSLPHEAACHADTIFLGPGEHTWPEFLRDLRDGRPRPRYFSSVRTLKGAPPVRRDLIKRANYLVPNSIVVSRGCPHSCAFCYKDSFYKGGRSFYSQPVDAALAEIDRLPGRHLYFLDDNLLGDHHFASGLFRGMRGMGRVWQAAATVDGVLNVDLLDEAVESGLRSLFVGFETLSKYSLREQNKHHNVGRDYERAIGLLRERGVMVNASFVFGMDADDLSVFNRTVEWAIERGVETATFHVLTPYPGTALHKRLESQGRIVSRDWSRYDTRHCVFRPLHMSAEELEEGYWRAKRRFWSWRGIIRGAQNRESGVEALRHLVYSGAWKKAEPLWSFVIRNGLLGRMRLPLEVLLDGCRTESSRSEKGTLRANLRREKGACNGSGYRAADV